MFRNVELEARRQIINYLQDFSRMMVEISGMVIKIFNNILNDDPNISLVYKEAKKIDKEAAKLQKDITSEILKSKPYLPNSEAIYTLVTVMGDIVNSLDGAGYRASHLNVASLPSEYIEDLRDIALKVHDEVDAFREAIYLLGYNPSALRAAIDKIYSLEQEVDEIYRSSLAYVFRTLDDSISLMKWTEIAERLENAADNVEKAADILVTFLML
jgi:uncharacterized protein Yka (UPF0111/DUF47 family)